VVKAFPLEERTMLLETLAAALNLTNSAISIADKITSRNEEEALKELKNRLEEIARIEGEARRKSQQIVLVATLSTLTLGAVGAGIVFKWATKKNSG
jgi:hypothetical protein